ncbi:Maf family protein [Alphaproteobacteria bacterium]|nr:Maf family protein [Alphaproteobacteria bacterium]
MTLAVFTQLPAGDLVLASASIIRAKILHDVGLGYRCYPVVIDEESVRASASAEAVPVGDIAIMLAEMKAAAAVQRLAFETDPSPAFVLGCDQILACDEVIYSKPHDRAMAKAQLMALSGKTHQLFSAAVLYRNGARIWHHLAIAKITMRRLDEDFIESYLDRLGAAALTSPASYQIENLGAHLLSRIDGCHFSILGLPLLELLGILREHGLKPAISRR